MSSNDMRFFGHGHITKGTDTKLPIDCLVCIDSMKGCMTTYARPIASRAAHLKAAIYADTMCQSVMNEEYIDYYMLHYRIEYRKVYNELFEKYRVEYYNKLLEKTYRDTDMICEYHKYAITYAGSTMV